MRGLKPQIFALTLAALTIPTFGCGDGAGPTGLHGSSGSVGDGRVSTVQVSPSSVSVEEGVKAPLSCSALDGRGVVLSTTPTWTTSDPNVVTVTPNGAVVGQNAGSAIVGCTVDGKTATSTVTVTGSPVAFVEVSPGAGTLPIGNSIQLSAVPRDINGIAVPGRQVEFVTADTSVVSVSPTGSVVGLVEGTADVIAVSGGRASLAKINVSPKVAPVTSMNVVSNASSVTVGGSIRATANTFGPNGQTLNNRAITWSVADPRVASIIAIGSDKATITGLVGGQTTVTATSEGISARFGVTVVPAAAVPVTAAKVVVTLSQPSVYPGNAAQATAAVTDASGNVLTDRTVTWTSMDPSIAVVSQSGLVTGMTTGAVIIRATVDGKTGDASLTVAVPPVAEVDVALTSSSVSPGQTTQATAVAKDANGRVLTGRSVAWASMNTSVATVSIAGVVTSVSSGSAMIQATVESQTGDASLTVAQPVAVATVQVSFGATSLTPGQTTQATAIAKDASGATITGRAVTWSSVTPSIATVSSAGVVTAVAAGAATIRATVDTKTGDGALTVASVTPVAVANVSVQLGLSSLTAGQTTQAVAVATDASGAPLTGRAVSWSSLTPAVATVSASGLVTAVGAGSATIRATVDTKTGDGPVTVLAGSTTVPAGIADAELPRVLLSTSVASTPSTGRTLNVGGSFQQALDTAVAGDRIVLACGSTASGNFILRPRSGGIAGQWITITSSCSLPGEGTRTSPTSGFAKISSPNMLPAIATNGPAARYRFVGVEVTVDAGVSTNQGLVALGCPNACETSLSEQPTDIIFDRSYVHGTPTLDVRRCLAFNGARLSVIDSYVSDCHSAFDAQAVAGWNGPGPYKIVNNRLEGSAEAVAFGGADPSITNLIPTDIEIRGNYMTRPMSWKGGPWLIKNILELKVGRRVLIDGNVMENAWPNGQAGFAFVLWSVNQQATCPWCVTEHVMIRNNLIRNTTGGWTMVATGANGLPQYLAQPMNHVTIRNNMVLGLNNSVVSGSGAYGRIFEISDTISALTIEHNTAFSPTNASFVWAGAMPLPQHIVRNNLLGGGQYQLFSSWGQGQTAWDHVAGPGSIFAGNIVVGFNGGPMISGGNWNPGAFTDVGLLDPSAVYSPSATPDQLGLTAASTYKGKATDGTDPGANVAAINAAIAGVVRP